MFLLILGPCLSGPFCIWPGAQSLGKQEVSSLGGVQSWGGGSFFLLSPAAQGALATG